MFCEVDSDALVLAVDSLELTVSEVLSDLPVLSLVVVEVVMLSESLLLLLFVDSLVLTVSEVLSDWLALSLVVVESLSLDLCELDSD